MSEVPFIVLVRAIHVMSGVTWAGAAFVLATAIIPVLVPTGADNSVSGLVLKSGMMAALLSLAVGVLIGRPAGLGIARVYASRDGTALSPEATRQLSRLHARTVLSARVAAALLGFAVLSMAVFRYAAAAG